MTPITGQTQRAFEGRLFQVDVIHSTDESGRAMTREVVRHPGAVVIVPLLDDARIVMIRNYRIAVGEELLELPAGMLEPGEPPHDAAGRELVEETGYSCSDLKKLGEFYTSPGFADELMHAFVAKELVKSRQKLEPGEQIRVEVVEFANALQMIGSGGIRDGKTIAALLMWDRRGRGRES